MTLQELFLALDRFWAARGCALLQPHDGALGAAAMHPGAFFRALGPEPWRAAYAQPTRRPADGRYARSPDRAQRYYSYLVVLKPSPDDAQEVYLESLSQLGIPLRRHDVRFVDDDWESASLGAAGVGWEVRLDGMAVTRFAYLQQMASIALRPASVAITYGAERLAMLLQGVGSLWDLEWAPGIRYGEIGLHAEASWCRYQFEVADTERLSAWLAAAEAEATAALAAGLVVPAYDCALRCAHALSLLESRGALGTTERATAVERVRRLARQCAEGYLAERERLGFPLMQPA
ncbi:MAG: glycine--tRNA ligase subunit alpha [Armatimonadetes bacterium]|nr:glycine--tRNA ligase subunit alpha [Armatimonadota bacterium]